MVSYKECYRRARQKPASAANRRGMRYESVCETNDGIAGKNLCLTCISPKDRQNFDRTRSHRKSVLESKSSFARINTIETRSRVSSTCNRVDGDHWMRRRIGMRRWRGGAKIFHRLTEFRAIFILRNMVEKSKDKFARLYSRGATRRPQRIRKFEIQATLRRLESTRQVNFPKIKEERRLEFCYETEGGRSRCNS